MSFDEKVKDMAAHGTLEIPGRYSDRIDGILYDILQKKAQDIPTSRWNRKAIAALCVAATLLVGCTAYAIADWYTTYNWKGAVERHEALSVPESTPIPDDTSDVMDTQTLLERCGMNIPNAVTRIIYPDGSSSGGIAATEFEGYDSFAAHIRSAEPAFGLPVSLPQGYRFSRAHAGYYISPESMRTDTPPDETLILDDGTRIEAFLLPEGYERYVHGFYLECENEAGDRFVFTGMLVEKGTDVSFGGSHEAMTKPLNLQGFSEALYINEPSEHYLHSRVLYTLQKIEPIAGISVFDLDFSCTETGKRGAPITTQAYDSIMYDIQANTLSEEEIVAIMENLVY